MPDGLRRVALWLKVYLFLELILTSLWTQLDALRWGTLPLFALVIALELKPEWFVPGGADAAAPIEPLSLRVFPARPHWTNVAIGLVISLPILLHLILTLREEFPFAGDEGYEFSATRSYALLLRQTVPYLAGLAVLVFAVVGRFGRRMRWTVFLAGLLVLSYRFPAHPVVARYPATFYFLAAPLNVLGELLRWKRPFVANHVVNALSVPVWLFVLRPVLLRKWPDWTIVPLGVFVFYQKEMLQFFAGGSALEPWALVLLCLAVEALVVLPDVGGWLALVLLGGSFMTKEQGVFLFPAVWLIAAAGSKRAADRLRYAACGIVVLAPFAVYYMVRRAGQIHRTVGFGEAGSVFTQARLHEWVSRVIGQFGVTGLVAVMALVVWGVAGFGVLRHEPRLRRVHAGLFVTALALTLFNFVDALAVPFTAYTRYMMYPVVLVGLLLTPAAVVLHRRRGPWAVALMASAILTLQAVPLARTLALDLRPDVARNSLEWRRIPMFFPVRELLERMGERPEAAAVKSVRLLGPAVDPIVAPIAYPDLNRRWPIHPEEMVSPVHCACRADGEAVLLGVEFRANLALETPADRTVVEAAESCIARIRSTCRATEIRHDTGDLIGILGVAPNGDR